MSHRDPFLFNQPSTAPPGAHPDAGSEAINSTVERIKRLVAHLNERFNEIGSVTGVITGLSKRSNLLALNASIEAARAGVHGRGFGVVADEVRRLSDNTSAAAADISRKLETVQAESRQAVAEVELAEQESALQMAALIAARDAAVLEQRFLRIAATQRGIRHFIVGSKSAGLTPRREDIDALMAESLRANPDLLAFSCGCEPDALDGRDAEYVNRGPGHDKSGRYVPYWHRGNGQVCLEALANYDVAGENDYYEIPRRTSRETLMEPYRYPVGGRDVLMTSLMMPLVVQDRFIGVVGADYALSQLQEEIGVRKPFGQGALVILSHRGTYVTHPDPRLLGESARDLTAEALAAVCQGAVHHYVDAKGIARVFHPLHIGGDTPWSMMVMFDLRAAIGEGGQGRKAVAGGGVR